MTTNNQTGERYRQAIAAFDRANSLDPNLEAADGSSHPAELLYSKRMSEWLDRFEPDASESLKLAARSQHIERWIIPRDEYPMNRAGYLKWRNELKKHHAARAGEIMEDSGYGEKTVRHVQDLVMKKGLKSDPEAQTLEDVVCLVFINYYLDDFSSKHEEEKLIRILKKTWRKMSQRGRETALKLDLPEPLESLINKALEA